MKKRSESNSKIYLVLSLIVILIIPLVSANVFIDIKNFITGMDTSDTTSLSITLSALNDPVIDSVSTIPLQSITEDNSTNVTFSFVVTDLDLVDNLNDSSARASFNRTGEATRDNATCTVVDLNTTSANYTCAIDMWYWDLNGDWTVNVTIGDMSGAHAHDNSTTFQLDLTTAMVMSPTALSWPTLALTATNQLAYENITINNTGNKNITDGNLNVTAFGLQGVGTPADTIEAGNFTVHTAYACDAGNPMVNETSIEVAGGIITRGNISQGDGQEQIFFCLEIIPSGISLQEYNTAGSSTSAWTIGVK